MNNCESFYRVEIFEKCEPPVIIYMFLVLKAATVENWKEKMYNELMTRVTNFVTLQSDGLKVGKVALVGLDEGTKFTMLI